MEEIGIRPPVEASAFLPPEIGILILSPENYSKTTKRVRVGVSAPTFFLVMEETRVGIPHPAPRNISQSGQRSRL